MERREFERLPAAEKLRLLHEEGVYIGKHSVDGKISVLYQLDGFYIEIFYREYRVQIEQMRSFDSPEDIDKYLP